MSKNRPYRFFLVLSAVLICGVMGLILVTQKPNILHAYLIALNVVTFFIYGLDKRQAIRCGMRAPEMVLHVLALAGGSPAAALAQLIFRHKTKKTSFRVLFFLIVALQAAAVLTAVYLAHQAA